MNDKVTLQHYNRKLLMKAEQYNHPLPFPDYLIPYINGKPWVIVADLGSGPIPTIGTVCNDCRVVLVASDLLAEKFKWMLEEAGIVPVTPVEEQDMEHLTYGNDAIDIVHCVNALDHVKDAPRALSEMVRVCKHGGAIYLKHFPNEGDRKNYCGFHCWNIEQFEDDCRIWNENDSFLLHDLYPNFKTVRDGRMIISTMVKGGK